MSNGIYILQTKDGYRVAYMNTLESIYDKFNTDTLYYSLNPKVVKESFGNSFVFDDEKNAQEYAVNLTSYLDIGIHQLADGIGYIIKDAKDKTFNEIIENA